MTLPNCRTNRAAAAGGLDSYVRNREAYFCPCSQKAIIWFGAGGAEERELKKEKVGELSCQYRTRREKRVKKEPAFSDKDKGAEG